MKLESFRSATLKNNIAWLKSFGCKVRRTPEYVQVDCPPIPEYCAIVVLTSNSKTLRYIQDALRETASTGTARHVYIDRSADSDPLQLVLQSRGYYRASASKVWGGPLLSHERGSTITVAAAKPSERSAWARLYSEGFGRQNDDAQADQVRWRRAFNSPLIVHWFIEDVGVRIGVCQTCIAYETIGIYSFTMLPTHKGHRRVISALRALETKLASVGPKTIYFERVDGASAQYVVPSVFKERRFFVVRAFDVYSYRGNKA